MPWDLVSSAYTDEVVPAFEAYATDALRLASPPAGSRIVDVACGPGTLTMLAAKQGLRVDAIDFSPAMVERFEARRLTLGVSDVTVRVGDGQELPFADRAYAAAFSMFGLMFFPDRARGFRELARVLEPGARAVISSWPSLDDNRVFEAMFDAIGETVSRLTGAPPRAPVTMPLSTEALCREEMSASFDDVVVHRIVHTQTYASPDAMWASMARTTAPLVMMRRGLGEEVFTAVAEAARAAIARALGGGPAVMEMPAWVTVGVAR